MRWTRGRRPGRTYFLRFLIVSQSSEYGGMLKLERGARFAQAGGASARTRDSLLGRQELYH